MMGDEHLHSEGKMPTDTEAHQRCIKLEQKVEKLVGEMERAERELKKENAKLWAQLMKLDRRTEGSMRLR